MVITGNNIICKNVTGKKSISGNILHQKVSGLTMILPLGQGSIQTIKTLTSAAIVFRH